jgi:hypothetical protein
MAFLFDRGTPVHLSWYLRALIEQISKIHDQFHPKWNYEHQRPLDSLSGLVETLSRQYQKQAILDYKSFRGDTISYQYRLLIRDILVQFVRNSVYHGIEVVSERKQYGKTGSGKISVASKTENGNFILCFKDDGHVLSSYPLRKTGYP